MSQSTPTTAAKSDFGGNALAWVASLPDGAVSIEIQDEKIVLRASQQLQQRFEELVERRKNAILTAAESKQYDAICDLDDVLSWLNRLMRSGL